MPIFRIAFIGVGNMGSRMAVRLIKAGHKVVVFDRNTEAVDNLAKKGAIAAGSAGEAAYSAEFILTSLPYPSTLEAVTEELVVAAPSGAVVLDLSTVDPTTSRTVAERLNTVGIDFLDTPVSGGTAAAASGQLVIMVGGASNVLDRSRPVLDELASNIIHCGGLGIGQLTKLAHNLLTAINTVALSEVLTASVTAGADLKTLREVLSAGLAGSKMLDYLPQTLLSAERPANFALNLMNKDIGLALKEFEHYPMYLGQLTHQMYNTAISQGLGGEDSTGVATVYEQLYDVRLQA